MLVTVFLNRTFEIFRVRIRRQLLVCSLLQSSAGKCIIALSPIIKCHGFLVIINIFLRPILSATNADIGIKRPKNKTENNWINKASLLVKPKSEVAQLRVKTVIK